MLKTNFQANVYNEKNELIYQTLGEFYKRQSNVEIIYLKDKLPKFITIEVVKVKNLRKGA
jgi:hypothetical protein